MSAVTTEAGNRPTQRSAAKIRALLTVYVEDGVLYREGIAALDGLLKRVGAVEARVEALEAALAEIDLIDDGWWGEGKATPIGKVVEMSRLARAALAVSGNQPQ